MDPEQALRDATTHLVAAHLCDAATALAGYWAWRRKGGFEPRDGDRRARDLGRHLASAGKARDDNHGDAVTLTAAVDAVLAGLLERPAS